MIFISSRSEWLYQLLWPLQPDKIRQLRQTRQFGNGPWHWTGLRKKGDKEVIDSSGKPYLFHQISVDNYPGWKIVHLYDLKTASKLVSEPLLKIIRPVIIILCVLLGASIFFLYRQASLEIARRRTVEQALRKSEERYRSLYHHTPAMLHSIDKMESWSVSAITGLMLLDTHEKRSLVKNLLIILLRFPVNMRRRQIIPTFFKKGFIKDIPYQFIKKNEEIIDVQISAIADRDEQQKTFRSLAVSIDVTERNKAERALQEAKEALSSYSKDLESQVRKRTREISGILQYTPAVVYIKDADGKYTMVNSRFEGLFGIRSSDVRGKTDKRFSRTGYRRAVL